MAAVAQPAEQLSELLQNLKVDAQNQASDLNPEAPPNQDESSSDGSADASASGEAGDAVIRNVTSEGAVEGGMYYMGGMNGYPPHGYIYNYPQGGFESPMGGEWDEYSTIVVEGAEHPSPAVYGDNGGSVFLHATGYGYASQPSYSPYNPGTPIPTIGADGQLYGPQAFQYQNHMYQQPLSPGAQYMASPNALAGGDVPLSGTGEPTPPGVDGKVAMSNGGPRPGYPAMALIPPHGPYGRGVLPLAIHTPGSQDVRYEGLRAAAPSWADVTKTTDGQQRPGAPSMVSQQLPAPGVPAQPLRHITPLQVHIQSAQHQRTPLGLASPNLGPGSLPRGYAPLTGVMNGPGGPGRARGNSSMETRPNGRGGWIGIDKGKQRGRGGGGIGNSNGGLDPLNEQNRGPRTIRNRNQRAVLGGVMRHTRGQGGNPSGNTDSQNAFANRDQYNKADFVTNYDNAKFFVIKSYSEDDIHKSIKYNVWASTPVGNKRLDSAYQEALTKCGGDINKYPVFLFFSVNASGQFCGVAQMTGPVDFAESVDYWQQDKWNGRFPVAWHIIKDIPNCQFRHIILENNDNKPVTNSRDTQEVKFEQGTGMLNIFKSFCSKTSILDDFQFYENRQRALTEKRARQQVQQQREQQRQQGGGWTGGNEHETALNKEESSQPKQEMSVGTDVNENTEALPTSTSDVNTSEDLDSSSTLLRSLSDTITIGVAECSISEEVKISEGEEKEQVQSGQGSDGIGDTAASLMTELKEKLVAEEEAR